MIPTSILVFCLARFGFWQNFSLCDSIICEIRILEIKYNSVHLTHLTPIVVQFMVLKCRVSKYINADYIV